MRKLTMVAFSVLLTVLLAGNVMAYTYYPPTYEEADADSGLTYTYQDDESDDASGGWKYEIHRMGYSYDDENLYFSMVTGMPQDGRLDRGAMINSGDLYINVGGSLSDGYTGTGTDATYASGDVYGLALTSHSGDMNNDMAGSHSAYTSGYKDDGYTWAPVTEGNLYSDAIFSTGVYEGYRDDDTVGDDPFGDANNSPVHIAQYGGDMGSQGGVSWNQINSTTYEVTATIALDALGLQGGGAFEFWWTMECGNDSAWIAGNVNAPSGSETPEPGTMALLGFGLLGLACYTRKFRKN
ncbi:MAG: hypothetical protein DRI57_18080 [Deltaproteobacteria bacterium]|nr:MAG: hypothetical protein DRI57_18080 [Deltaproteobacteria bacterium]